MTYAWESTALDLLAGLKLTIGELEVALISDGYAIWDPLVEQWAIHNAEIGVLARTAEHPPRFSVNKNREAV